MPSTGPPAPPTAASRRPARPGTSSATPPGSSALAYLTRDPALMPLVLITRLAALAEAVAELRHAQQHAAQAAAARTAAERLHAATRSAPGASQPANPRARAAVQLDLAAQRSPSIPRVYDYWLGGRFL
jgi:hypothetical protein